MNWRRVTLGELCEGPGAGIQTGPFGTQLHAEEYSVTGIPVVMPQDLGENLVTEERIARIPSEIADRLDRHRLREGDIVYSRRGDVEKRALVTSDEDGWICGTGCLRVRLSDRTPAHYKFVSYALGDPEVRSWIRNHAVGATMPNLNTSILAALPIRVPESIAQQRIADVLCSLDEKAAANERLVGLLEERFEVILDATATHAGRGVLLSQVADFQNRRRVPLSSGQRELRVGDVPYWGANGILDSVDEAIFDEIIVLVGEDGSVVRDDGKPFVHYVWGPSWVNNHAHVLTGRAVSTDLLYYLVKRADVSQFVTGAVQPKLSLGNLKRLELKVPGSEDIREVEVQAAITQARIRGARDESRTLAALRDTILPALMSGRLSVREAEAAVSEVV